MPSPKWKACWLNWVTDIGRDYQSTRRDIFAIVRSTNPGNNW